MLAERKRKAKNRKKRNIAAPLIVLGLAVLILLAAVFAAAAEAGSDKIIRNVYVDGIRIGGMNPADAVSALEEEFSKRTVTISVDGEDERSFTPEQLGLRYKTDALVGEAYSIGKNGSFAENVAAICRSFFISEKMSSSEGLVCSEPSDEFYDYIGSFTVQPTESSFTIDDEKVTVTNGMNGREVDIQALLDKITALSDFENTVEAPINILPFTLPSLDDIYTKTASSPRPPYARSSDGSITATVKVFNLDIAREIQKENSLEGETYEFLIDSESVVAPDDDLLFPDIIGEKTTVFDTGYTTRAANIRLAAGLLDGADLLPGETFSFNERIGEITAEKGYQSAKGYSNGTVVDTVGAGVCQLSSTLYNAALYSGMEIVKRSSHSLPISYLPLGQDAAISYPAQDFKFKNSSDAPIKIRAYVDGGNLTVEIHGRKSGDFTQIDIINSTLSVLNPKTREVIDETLAAGQRVVTQKGSKGYVVESFRVYSKDGVEIKRENLGKSTYKAQDTIVSVGKEEESL